MTALLQPLMALRATLGTASSSPDQTLLSALQTATTGIVDTDLEHGRALHALESSWDTSSDVMPVMARTRREIATTAELGPEYAALLTSAHTTNAAAARRVEQIIAEFRRDGRALVDTATTAPDGDGLIDLASHALREALTVVDDAQLEMDEHTRRLRGREPAKLTTPQSWSASPGVVQLPGAVPGLPGMPGSSLNLPSATAGQPVDPAVAQAAIQAQMQQTAILAGIQIGGTVLEAGVELGTHLIDKIAEVGTKTMDTVAASAQTAIQEGLNPAHPAAAGAPSPPATPAPLSLSAPTPRIDFGPTAATPAPATPAPATNAAEEPQTPTAPTPKSPADPAPSSAPNQTGAGLAAPPRPAPPAEPEHTPRGQLGVTVPAPSTPAGDGDRSGT
ncbi:hypothetical protein ACFQZZ_33300 [Nocardia sp. GCM10030253]|uniref:hypothetical protein n=1 Tax=Nocardia sp. GCM10030253 TaxID=3273404 RepID=UPI00362BCA16